MLRGVLNKSFSLLLLALAASGATAADLRARVADVDSEALTDAESMTLGGDILEKTVESEVGTLLPQVRPGELALKFPRYQANPDAP